MRVHLHEITDQETELAFDQEEPWVLEAVECVDEEPARAKGPARPVEARLSLRKVDGVVVVSGGIRTYLRLLCSRCAGPFRFDCAPRFSALFCDDPVMAGVGHLERNGRAARPAGQNHGFARHAHDAPAGEGDGAEPGFSDLDITYVTHDYIDLGEILTEQLRLQVPFQPLCDPGCKGMCHHCGADLNRGRCACPKIVSSSPFAALKDSGNR